MVLSLAFFGVGAYLGVLAAQQLKDLAPVITGPDHLVRLISDKARQLVNRSPPTPNVPPHLPAAYPRPRTP